MDTDFNELMVSGLVNDSDGFSLTPDGFKDAQVLWNNLDEPHKIALSRIKVVIQILEYYRRFYSIFLIFPVDII